MGKRGYNLIMKKFLRKITPVIIVIFAGLSGCQTAPAPVASPTGTPTPQIELTLYETASPTGTATPFPTPKITQKPKLPTSTPFTHSIQEGDTLSGIALRYGSSVDAILGVNPGVNPNLLVIGEEVVIPAGDEGAATNLPTTTPVPLALQPPQCLPANQGGLWCFVLAAAAPATPPEIALENVSAVVSVHTQEGEIAASEVALPLLNVLQPGEMLPLMAYFAPPLPESFQVSATLLTALPASEIETQTSDTVHNIAYSSDGLRATLMGEITLSPESVSVKEIWVVVIAYDIEGNVVGSRKLILQGEFAPGESVPFEVSVFSLGPVIAKVEVFSEGRAVDVGD